MQDGGAALTKGMAGALEGTALIQKKKNTKERSWAHREQLVQDLTIDVLGY